MSALLRAGARRVPGRLVVPAAVWVAVVLLSALVAPGYRLEALGGVARVAGGLLIGWVAYHASGSHHRAQQLFRALALSGVGIALFGLGEVAYVALFASPAAHLVPAPLPTGDIARATAGLGHPNAVAMMLELSLPLVLVWTVVSPRGWKRGLLAAALVATVLALLLTFSRGGLLACLASLGLMAGAAAWCRRADVLRGVLATIVVLGILMAAVAFANPGAIWRLAAETEQRWYRAAYDAPEVLVARPGESILVPILVTNLGEWTWHEAGPYRFALGYHLARADGTGVVYDGPSSPFPSDVPPSAVVEVRARMVAPAVPGEYVVEWDGVQEAVTWFSWRGMSAAVTRLEVAGEPVAEAERGPPAVEDGVVVPAPGRLISWEMALRMVAARPILGFGPDNFPHVYEQYAGTTRWPAVHSHNLYLEWLAGAGIAGLAAFLWFNWRIVSSVAGSLRSGRKGGDPAVHASHAWIWQLAFAGSLSAWFVHGFFDYFERFPPAYLAFWLIVGVATRAAEVDGRGEQVGR